MKSDAHEQRDASRRPLVIGFVITMVASVIGTVAVLGLLHSGRRHVRLMPNQPRYYLSTPTEVNEVESAPYVLKTDAERGAAAAQTRLKAYGWVDRDRQLVHVPLEVAIDTYLQRQQTAEP